MKEERFNVYIDVCEGPLSLLLYLIEKERIDIKDVKISQITEQFIEYINFIKDIQLAEVGDFIVMAARLMKIKSDTLLPQEVNEEEIKLKNEILDYKRYKNAAAEFEIMSASIRFFFRKPYEIKEEEKYIDVSIFALIDALRKLTNKLPDENDIKISRDMYPVEYMIDVILTKLKDGMFGFLDFFKNKEIPYIVSGFLAILELLKRGRIKAVQKEPFGEIYIYE